MQHYHICRPTAAHPPPHHQAGFLNGCLFAIQFIFVLHTKDSTIGRPFGADTMYKPPPIIRMYERRAKCMYERKSKKKTAQPVALWMKSVSNWALDACNTIFMNAVEISKNSNNQFSM
ncbi:hypothetical protein ACB092_01G104100 [Castanea dentata]